MAYSLRPVRINSVLCYCTKRFFFLSSIIAWITIDKFLFLACEISRWAEGVDFYRQRWRTQNMLLHHSAVVGGVLCKWNVYLYISTRQHHCKHIFKQQQKNTLTYSHMPSPKATSFFAVFWIQIFATKHTHTHTRTKMRIRAVLLRNSKKFFLHKWPSRLPRTRDN